MTHITVGAAADDVEPLLELLRGCGLPSDGLLDHLGTTLLARDGERIVGSAALEIYDDGALLRSVAVAGDRRGERLGHELTDAALDLARRRRVPAVYLLTQTAEEFFPRFGFERIDRAQVPAGVKQSVEFTTVCCSSAAVMRKTFACDNPSHG